MNGFLGFILLYLLPLVVVLYVAAAWSNAKTDVAFYEDLVESYEGHVRFWKAHGNVTKHNNVLATLIKHRRSLARARKYSWPFTIRTDRDVIAGASEEEKRVDEQVWRVRP